MTAVYNCLKQRINTQLSMFFSATDLQTGQNFLRERCDEGDGGKSETSAGRRALHQYLMPVVHH